MFANTKALRDALGELLVQVNEDCPPESRTKHLKAAMDEAFKLLNPADDPGSLVPRFTTGPNGSGSMYVYVRPIGQGEAAQTMRVDAYADYSLTGELLGVEILGATASVDPRLLGGTIEPRPKGGRS